MAKFMGRVEFPCTIELGKGLEGAITNITKIGYVDGQEGHLVYRGYSIEDLCENSNYEEVAYLLIYGNLPTASQLADFESKMRAERTLPDEVKELIKSLPHDCHPMNALQAAVAAMGCMDHDGLEVTRHVSNPKESVDVERDVAVRILAQTRNAAAAIARVRKGGDILDPNPELDFTANYLYMMSGEIPDETRRRVMDVCLILQADHGMNASTFTAMVVHSSLADMYSTIAAAIGSLRGPLHGGANEAALADIQSIGTPDKAKEWVASRFAQNEKIIGFGHRVYKALDPRAVVLKGHAERLCREHGFNDLYESAATVEKEVTTRMEAAGKKIYPNVDFYSGLVYHALGFPTPQFPVIFAVARTAGWVARVLEYLPENRIFRPRAVYDGAVDQKVVPINQR
ncbi:MAG: citrate/2-methylcitrate synthase [Phycisphaerales bacterium]|nr:citrate/2-methylcitrate synthase [Phycisphaerales bacterium]MCB9862491.1 citrate/2-methylcitrate synthase [Phycisphaerales bacterium]